MYYDGLFETTEISVRSESNLPEDVMILHQLRDIDRFIISSKDLAIGCPQLPNDYQYWIESSLNREDFDFEENSIEKIVERIDPVHLELCRPFLSILKKVEGSLKACQRVRLTIKAIRSQMCPLFHVDNLKLRFITSVIGPGTQWLEHKDVFHKNLGKGGKKPIAKPQAMLQQIQTGQVALLKGCRFPGSKGLVHRSPPVDPATKLVRLMIRCDFV